MRRNNIPAVLQRIRTESVHPLPSAGRWSRATGHGKRQNWAGFSDTKLAIKVVECSTECRISWARKSPLCFSAQSVSVISENIHLISFTLGVCIVKGPKEVLKSLWFWQAICSIWIQLELKTRYVIHRRKWRWPSWQQKSSFTELWVNRWTAVCAAEVTQHQGSVDWVLQPDLSSQLQQVTFTALERKLHPELSHTYQDGRLYKYKLKSWEVITWCISPFIT